MKRIWNNPIWRIVIIAGALVLLIGIGVAGRRGPDVVETKTIAVKPTTLTVKLPENGVLSRPETTTIAAASTGNIQQIYVHEGQRVAKGALMMKLDDRQIATSVATDRATAAEARATLSGAQARLQADINAKSEGQISGGLGAASIGVSGASQLVQAEQTLTSAKLNLQTAKETYDADQELYKINGLPRQQLDKDKAAYDEAVANATGAQRQYDLLKVQLRETGGQLDSQIEADRISVASAQAQLDSANASLALHQSNLADTEVRAPFDGVVQQLGSTAASGTTTPLSVGDAITPGEVLFTIAGAGPMVVKAQVDEQDIINVKVGQQVIVTGEDFPGHTLPGYVTDIAAVVLQVNQAGNSAKNVETTISLAKDYPFLRAGMSCDVDIITGKATGALVVPLAAVFDDGGKHYVFVVTKGKVVKTEVGKGLTSDTDVVITKGLKTGDVVATTNVKDLKDGAVVKAAPAPSPSASASAGP
ncbi:MAG TPA: efflux RND transporter periplasmic adaptor subunit [Candidatus Eremiobacteraceae bacterium]|jgi:HlyD family secretion protein|nr:efflux RND transporter periplasmic adaptor subunit [Candidatus Eremiobacteraceae bacterium]